MPYTPPASRSPVASRPETPSLSRSHSLHKAQQQHDTPSNHGARTELPHSSSSRAYLHKHRRSPSLSKPSTVPAEPSTPEATPVETRSPETDDQSSTPRSHQDATSTKSSQLGIPTSASLSPPVSPQTSSDDESMTHRGRTREVSKLEELQAAIKIIEQHRGGSPDRQETKQARATLGLPAFRFDPWSTNHAAKLELSPKLPLSVGARKISHSRSTTDASAFFDFPRNKFDSPAKGGSESEDDEEDEDEDLQSKRCLIRKKSGELVRPALRDPSLRRRPTSMPGTPTYSKAVHFQENSLEHVRHFLQVDRPIAVSAGSSPVESSFDDENEFPFGGDNSASVTPPFDWEIRLSNFPRDSIDRSVLPVRTERVYLSPDTKILIGAVAVQNLAFHKLVVVRFTLDYWKTTSEVVAEYNRDVRKKQANDRCDRFTFNIKLEDQANLENKTMFFCVRYNVNGQEYWDNNNATNYQVDFSKKFKPQNGKHGMQAKSARPLGALPRSKPSSTSSPRPRSMPSFDDFSNSVSPFEFSSFPQPSDLAGESPIRFKNRPSNTDIASDAPGRSTASANQQAFSNRYDFGASLSAAIQAASSTAGDRSNLLRKKDVESISPKGVAPLKPNNERSVEADAPASHDAGKDTDKSDKPRSIVQDHPNPAALTADKPSVQSPSYHELLDKYCFFGSSKATSHPTTPAAGQLDGPSGDVSEAKQAVGQLSRSSTASSPGHDLSTTQEQKSSPNFSSHRVSRPTSPTIGPVIGSRTASPVALYTHSQPLHNDFFIAHAPTAIRG